jgi:hypothetical protein
MFFDIKFGRYPLTRSPVNINIVLGTLLPQFSLKLSDLVSQPFKTGNIASLQYYTGELIVKST